MKKEQQARINVHHMEMFARFLTKLNNMPAGDGNMLDHSMILYGSGMSESNVHSRLDVPTIIAGGAAGQVKGNRHIKAPKETPLANLMVEFGQKYGVEMEKFGVSTGRVEL